MAMLATPYVEDDCTVSHEGQTFTAAGALITDDYAIGYVRASHGEHVGADVMIDTWHGQTIGFGTITARWRVWSYIGSHMCQIEATINGRKYTGRGFGNAMIWRGKVKASQ